MKKGFDNDKYVKIQSKKIRERFKLFDKLYLEIGGKLFEDTISFALMQKISKEIKLEQILELPMTQKS